MNGPEVFLVRELPGAIFPPLSPADFRLPPGLKQSRAAHYKIDRIRTFRRPLFLLHENRTFPG